MFTKLKTIGCDCGKEHIFESDVVVGSGVLTDLPSILKSKNFKKPFVFADNNTYFAAGKKVINLLNDNGFETNKYVFNKDNLEPDESNVGLAIMHYYPNSDVIIGVGSGVINDICKIVAATANKPYIIVATAPSMDGYASASSSMTMEGLKISLDSKCADVILGDLDILCDAPLKMMISGLGDMLAKYVSICEWRIAHIITGEYYCEDVANLVRTALKKCVDNADGLLKRDKEAVKAVFEGLVLCGAAMKFAGVSRPASGVEHYLSHIWDMRGAEFGTPVSFHGIQCGIGTLIAVKLYEQIKTITPDSEKALDYVSKFNFDVWSSELRKFIGKGAECMIALEKKEQKYNKAAHAERLEKIINNWNCILKIIDEELPSSKEIEELLDKLGAPKTLEDIGLHNNLLPITFKATKDIRDKYVLSRLCWDLGIIDGMDM